MLERILLLRRMILLGLAVILLRLAHLQVIKGEAYHRLSESNRVRLVPEPAPRGLILDRNGRELASNQRVFRVAVVPQEARDPTALWRRLSSLVGETPDELARRFEARRYRPFMPVELASNVPKPSALRIEEERLWLPGVVVEARLSRAYPLGSVAAQVIGYLGRPSPEDLAALKRQGARTPEVVGRAGLEQKLDQRLQGQVGGMLIEVNSRGRQVRTLGLQSSQPGDTVRLTLDARLQALIERHFGDQPGACVVLEPASGDVMAMVSTPAFDPGAFIMDRSSSVRRMLEDPRSVLLNRAASGMYLPGSILKPLVALTALEHGVVTPTSTVHCPGFLQIGDRRFHCWNRDGHGPLSLHEALRESCNVYFLEMGRRLGQERLVAAFRRVGFGHPAGWLLGESIGYLPSGHLSGGETAMLAVGQGPLLITPLQAAVMAAALANGGLLVHPRVVAQVGKRTTAATTTTSLEWNPSHLAMVREGMRAVVNDPAGTGIYAHSEMIVIAGKTGTAQTHRPGFAHGWFIGFCPAEEPIAAFAIVAEFGGTGGDLPARIGKAICEYLAHPEEMEARATAPPSGHGLRPWARRLHLSVRVGRNPLGSGTSLGVDPPRFGGMSPHAGRQRGCHGLWPEPSRFRHCARRGSPSLRPWGSTGVGG